MQLWQFHPDDLTPVQLRADDIARLAQPSPRTGVRTESVLFTRAWETVRLETWTGSGEVGHAGGVEVLVLAGETTVVGVGEGCTGGRGRDLDALDDHETSLSTLGWLRLPPGRVCRVHTDQEAQVLVKEGHLANPPALPPT